MNRKAVALTVVLLLCFTSTSLTSISVVSSTPSTATRVYVDPANVTDKNLGENFTVVVKVENITDLYTWMVAMKWDPNVLECTKIQFMYDWFPGADALALGEDVGWAKFPWSINKTGGEIWPAPVMGRRYPLTTGIDGSGSLFNVTFQVINYGETWINLSWKTPTSSPSVQLVNFAIQTIPADVEDGWFELPTPIGLHRLVVETSWTNGSAIVGAEATISNASGRVMSGITNSLGLASFFLSGLYNLSVRYAGVTINETSNLNVTEDMTVQIPRMEPVAFEAVKRLQAEIKTLQGELMMLQADKDSYAELYFYYRKLCGNMTVWGIYDKYGEIIVPKEIDRLNDEITTLEGNVTSLQDDIIDLQAQITSLQNQAVINLFGGGIVGLVIGVILAFIGLRKKG